MVDPGHGTIDYETRIINSGRVNGPNLVEHELAMKIATKLGDMLRDAGAEVYFTRTKDDYWRVSYEVAEDNKARAYLANELKCDVYVSVHCDWHPSRKIQGVTTLYSKPDSYNLANAMQKSMVHELRAHDRKLIFDRFTVLENTLMPSVIVETGFLSNTRESRRLVQPDYQRRVAAAIVGDFAGTFVNPFPKTPKTPRASLRGASLSHATKQSIFSKGR